MSSPLPVPTPVPVASSVHERLTAWMEGHIATLEMFNHPNRQAIVLCRSEIGRIIFYMVLIGH